jgi:hypothetical protein
MDEVTLTPRASDSFKQKKIERLSVAIGMLMRRCEPWRLLTLETMPKFEPSYPWLSIKNVSFGNIHFKLQYIAYPVSEQDSPDWCVDINLYQDGNITIRNQHISFLSDIIDTLLMIKDSLEMDLIGTGRPFSIRWYIGKTAEIEHKYAYATTGDTDID